MSVIPKGGRYRSLSVSSVCPIREACRTSRAEFHGYGAGFITNLIGALFPRAYDDGEGRRRGGAPRGGDVRCPASMEAYQGGRSVRKSCAQAVAHM